MLFIKKMKFVILKRGNLIFDNFQDDHFISEIDYEILKDEFAERYYIRGWYNGSSVQSQIPFEIYMGIDMYLESELLAIRDELEKCL